MHCDPCVGPRRHDYGFQNPLCLEREAFKVAVAPSSFELETKLFKAVSDWSVICRYRDDDAVINAIGDPGPWGSWRR